MTAKRRRTAALGGGVAGLSAAYVLRRSHQVSLYEADDRLCRHTQTPLLRAALRNPSPPRPYPPVSGSTASASICADRPYNLVPAMCPQEGVK
ncbi:NAD(P)-binding protein [Streptomyces sp. NPDC060064]|uniref:NAD(P)-binding protein n=1 Tax=Streptomyces sp. NPDC060064 TaxID=3347049 RepID=UPI00368595E9